MSIKLLTAAAFAISMIAAPAAFAQNDAAGATANSANSSGPAGNNDPMATNSDPMATQSIDNSWTAADRSFYETNRAAFGGFFTDESMSTPRSQAEIDAAWAAMDQPNQAALIAACSGVSAEGGKYSAFTTELCAKFKG